MKIEAMAALAGIAAIASAQKYDTYDVSYGSVHGYLGGARLELETADGTYLGTGYWYYSHKLFEAADNEHGWYDSNTVRHISDTSPIYFEYSDEVESHFEYATTSQGIRRIFRCTTVSDTGDY